jgi:pimeloyl-ACP methyl ester carboxylesterase
MSSFAVLTRADPRPACSAPRAGVASAEAVAGLADWPQIDSPTRLASAQFVPEGGLMGTRKMLVLLTAVALAGGVAASAASAEAGLGFKRCGSAGFRCARLEVPLDRSGRVPGEVSLLIERHRARRARRPPLFVLAGGPGESATASDALDLALLDGALRRRDLVVFDQRGTGRSGALRCRQLERSGLAGLGDAVAECARRLGPRSALYSTRDSVEDIDAVRQALDARRIALFGISYGAKVATAYALRHPHRVERLALDSVVEPEGPSALSLDSFAATARVLRALCRGGGCRRITEDPVRDLEQLVGRLAHAPLRGTLITRRGKRRRGNLSRGELFSLLLVGDLDGSLRLPFPAALRSALRGDSAPILRLERRAQAALKPLERLPPRLLSVATFVATTCEETRLPWARTAPFGDRHRQAAAFVNALPASLFRPFDRVTALRGELLRLCERWPASPAAPALAGGASPDVPVLLLEGEDDLRTPVETAVRVAARFRSSRLLVTQETGHIASLSEEEDCARDGLQRFFSGRSVPRACPLDDFRIGTPSLVAPRSLLELRPVRGAGARRGRALRALQLTIYDAAHEVWQDQFERFTLRDVTRAGGLRAGSLRYSLSKDRLSMRGYSLVPGVRVSGVLRRFDSRRRVRGRLRLRGRATPDGAVRVRGSVVSGRLGRSRVRVRLHLDLITAVAATPRRGTALHPSPGGAHP